MYNEDQQKKLGSSASSRQKRSGVRLLSVMLMLIAIVTPVMSEEASVKAESEYDKYFREFSLRYFGSKVDWRLFKAQGMVESRLIHDAKSHAGARGVMQVMPVTFKEIQRKNPLIKTGNIHSAATNINAGVYYNSYLYQRWEAEVSRDLHIQLMLASYNGGYSRVLKAYNKAGAPENDWMAIAHYLPKETRNYVKRVIGKFQTLRNQDKPAVAIDVFLPVADPQPVVVTKNESKSIVPTSVDNDHWHSATQLD